MSIHLGTTPAAEKPTDERVKNSGKEFDPATDQPATIRGTDGGVETLVYDSQGNLTSQTGDGAVPTFRSVFD